MHMLEEGHSVNYIQNQLRKSGPLTRQEIKKVRPVMESSRKTAKKDTSGYRWFGNNGDNHYLSTNKDCICVKYLFQSHLTKIRE